MPTNTELIWFPAVLNDLRRIWLYYRKMGSVSVADQRLLEITNAAIGAAERPLQHRSRDDILPGLRSALARPHMVFFFTGDRGINISRVLHEWQRTPSPFPQATARETLEAFTP